MIRRLLLLSSLFINMGVQAQVPTDNKAAYFNGSSYLKIDQPIRNTFTFSAWINQDAVDKNTNPNGEGGTIISWGTAGYDEGVMCFDTRSGKLHWGIWDAGSGSYEYTDYAGLPNGKWVHIALTRNKNEYKLYLNGKKVTEKNLSRQPNIAMCHLGVNNSGGKMYRYFQGKMDEVMLLDKVYNEEDIKLLAASNAPAQKQMEVQFYFPFERIWNPWNDNSVNGQKVENNKMILSDKDNVFSNTYQMILSDLSLSAVTGKQPEKLNANQGEMNVSLGTVDVRFTGVASSVNLQDSRIKFEDAGNPFSVIRVYLSTEKDNFSTETEVAQMKADGTELSAIVNAELYGNARLRFEGDVAEDADPNKEYRYTIKGVTVKDKWECLESRTTTLIIGTDCVYQPKEMKEGLIRNPGMGLILYLDAFWQMTNNLLPDINKGIYQPDLFWKAFDECGATDVATTFYMRVPWSFVEPERGAYAWKDPNSNFNKLVNGARERGLRLAFRIYVDSKDSYTQATPEYVKEDGAKGTIKDRWTPYADDEVFLKDFKKFIAAFGEEYNNPEEVDFIDGMGLGDWGEGHRIPMNNGWPLDRVLDSIASYYRASFPDVLLGIAEGSALAGYAKSCVIKGNKIVTYDIRRRDSFGMTAYYSQGDRNDYSDYVINRQVPIFAENGWNYFGHRTDNPDEFNKYTTGAGTKFESVRHMLEYTMLTDVLPSRANTFDLRVPEDAQIWMSEENRDLVNKFVNEGGYRFVPERIVFPSRSEGKKLTIEYQFRNLGVGILPNATEAYKNKYKLCFAMVDTINNRSYIFPTNENLSKWTNLAPASGKFDCILGDSVVSGKYCVGFAIVDTRTNAPDIHMAVQNPKMIKNRWYHIGTVTVKNNTVGIDAVNNSKSGLETTAQGIFLLNGTKVADIYSEKLFRKMPQGIYIVNGSKMIR